MDFLSIAHNGMEYQRQNHLKFHMPVHAKGPKDQRTKGPKEANDSSTCCPTKNALTAPGVKGSFSLEDQSL